MTNPMPMGAPSSDALVAELLGGFERDPAQAGRQLRRLLQTSRQDFLAGVLEALKKPLATRGYRFLVTLLASNGLLFECVAARCLTRGEAVALARAAVSIEAGLDVWLAEKLAAEAASESSKLDDGDIARVLAVLDEISVSLRGAPALKALFAHPNARIRSKAALIVGRARQNPGWADRQLKSDDPRVRANSVEALWGGEDESCREVFSSAVCDPNCRVAGNGAIGLYRLGDTRAISILHGMSGSASAEFRPTAAWCMGETRDPRFLCALRQMVRENEGKPRQIALGAIARIRQNMARMAEAGRLRVEIAGAVRDGASVRVRVALAPESGGKAEPAPPTCWIATDNGSVLADYRVRTEHMREALWVGFAVPHRAGPDDGFGALTEQALLEGLKYRRPQDRWVVAKYQAQAREARVAIHVVAPPASGNTALAAMAAETGGRFLEADRTEEIPRCVQRLCLGLLSRYAISWPAGNASPDGLNRIKIEVWCDQGFGEDQCLLPPARTS